MDFESLFEQGTWVPKSTPVVAYTVKADIPTPWGIIPAGTKFTALDGSWKFVAAEEWDSGYTQI